TRSLLAYDTINPPGREQDCARRAGALLGEWGFSVAYHDYEPGRTSVVARAGGNDAKAPLCLTGHLDTVALGTRPWSKDPFAGEADGDRLYGRGVSDMKAGVAAILLAARNVAPRLGGTPGIVVVLTAAEEGGCGVNMVADTASLGVDIRTVPGMDHAALIARLRETLGEAEMDVFSNLPPVWTPPQQEWIGRVFDICRAELGTRPEPRTATYM